MRFLFLGLWVVGLAGCASTGPTNSTKAELSKTPLKAGECGLYGWAADETRTFVFFADKKQARYAGPDGPVDLKPQSSFPAVEYLDDGGRAVTLRLGQGEIMDGGMRYPGAVIVSVDEDKWERVRPVGIVRSCQTK